MTVKGTVRIEAVVEFHAIAPLDGFESDDWADTVADRIAAAVNNLTEHGVYDQSARVIDWTQTAAS